jgi:hypothetical protein
MKPFGKIKTKIEESMVKLYGKQEFKNHMINFKKNILENKEISKIFYIYDDLSSKKGLDKEIASDYVNESIEELQKLIDKNTKQITSLSQWIDGVLSEEINSNYSDIDNVVYNNKSIKNLENVLESKRNIKNLITTVKENVVMSESINIPLSSMLKIASNSFNKEFENISEEDKKELKELLSLTKNEVKVKHEELKESVLGKLKNNLNESTDSEITEKINLTIQKISESKSDLVSLYKLTQLNQGL